MSFRTWHNYGFGVCTNDLAFDSMNNIEAAKALCDKEQARCIEEAIEDFANENGISKDDPQRSAKILMGISHNEFEHPDQGAYSTIAEIALAGMIYEQEGLWITLCDDFNGDRYAIYEKTYPWEMSEKEKSLTERTLEEIITKYISVITNEKQDIGYYECENGG